MHRQSGEKWPGLFVHGSGHALGMHIRGSSLVLSWTNAWRGRKRRRRRKGRDGDRFLMGYRKMMIV